MKKRHASRGTVGLKHVAEYLGLNPATVSVVLNNTPGRSIPEATRERIRAAARELNYQPSLVARSLQSRRTRVVGILLPDLEKSYYTEILRGIAAQLMEAGYFYFTAHHENRKEHIEEYSRILLQRGAEAVIAIDTPLEHPFNVPVISVAGQQRLPGATNVLADHRLAAELLLQHLHALGHRHIAVVKGKTVGTPTGELWQSIQSGARKLAIHIDPEVVFDVGQNPPSPELGYAAARRLFSTRKRFSALVTFNHIMTAGLLRGLREMAIRVPEDISVAAFDDSGTSELSHPRVTAIRYRLCKMGAVAAQYVLDTLNGSAKARKQILLEPELIVRESTAASSLPAPKTWDVPTLEFEI
jgi:DNA-binding LacI/PurR family transcriptional regulator